MPDPFPPPRIELTAPAREHLRAALAADASARFVRIDVGRG
jgi:hypothetical protein